MLAEASGEVMGEGFTKSEGNMIRAGGKETLVME